MSDKLELQTQNGVVRYFRENMGTLIGLLVMCAILSFTTNGVFYSSRNLINVLRQVSSNACLAFGMTFAIITGGIDLSVGSILALAGTLSAGFIVNNNMSPATAIILAILIGTLCGLFNGYVIAKT
ncbi:MAG: ABC transporter permease, partial [Synergistaceae bacterium]|nr:ABC transporter permease [Synergistaceae bacterium]